MPRKRVLRLAVLLCLWLVGSINSLQSAEADPFASARLKRLPRAVPMPEVNLPDPAGKQVPLRSFKGQVVLMNFWTTW